MLTRHTLCLSLLVVSLCLTTALAQDESAKSNNHDALTITASASAGSVRFTAPSSAVQIRLEVYDSTGKKMFDNEVRGGNVLDWLLQDGQAKRLADDSYLCAVTVKSTSGRLIQRIGSVTVGKGAANVQAVVASQMSAQQSEAIGPVEENASMSVLNEEEPQTPTVIAHNGDDGQITRGKGALSFRIGDFYRGKDTEQMRLTAEGNLGIGITHPQARLDVDGVIRAGQGIMFPDGSIQYSAASKTLGVRSTMSDQASDQILGGKHKFQTEAAGIGTQDRIAKWINTTGTLGDSVLSEFRSNLIHNGTNFQMTSPAFSLFETNVIFLDATYKTMGMIAGSTENYLASNGPFFAMRGNTYSMIGGQRGSVSISAGNVSFPSGTEGSVKFNTGNDQVRMIIDQLGNVGIGTTTPGSLLHLAGGNVLNTAQGDLVMSRFWASPSNTRGSSLFHYYSSGSGNDMLVFGVAGDAGFAQQSYLTPNRIGMAKMVILANGNVGIGSTAPASRLSAIAVNVIGSGNGGTGIDVKGGSTTGGGLNVGSGGDGLIVDGGACSGCGNSGGVAIRARGGSGGFRGAAGMIVSGGAVSDPSAFGGWGLYAGAGFNSSNIANRSEAIITDGNVLVQGSLSVLGSKNFKIDHPLDPENKYLLHAAIESSEVLNLYSGNVMTNEDGNAVVKLPEWTEAINTEFRYQLTVVGTFAQAIIAEKIKGNSFVIKTNAPGVEVSWQVTGVRSDPYMVKHPFKVEEDKPQRERGSYLSPEAYGQTEEKGMTWARSPELMRQMKEQREGAPKAKRD